MVDLQTFLDVWLSVMAQTVGLGLMSLSGVWVGMYSSIFVPPFHGGFYPPPGG